MKKSGLLVVAVMMGLAMDSVAAGTGTLNRASGWYSSGSNFTVTATAASNSVFASWSGNTNGCTITGNQIAVTANQARQITALFSTARFWFSVSSLYGTATPGIGSYTNDYGTVLTPSVTSPDTRGTTQYVCTGWAMTGNSPASGTSNSLTMTQTNNAALTWLWKTNYYLATSCTGSGSVNVASAWYTNGASVAVTATPTSGWNLAGWVGDTNGCTIAGNVITAPMSRARSLVASFALAQKTLQVVSPFGVTVPAVGLYTNSYGTVLSNYVVSPDTRGTTQYVCNGWTMTGNGPLSGTGTNFTMTVTNNATLTWKWTTNYWVDLSVTGN